MDQASETPSSQTGYQTVAELLYVAKLTRIHVDVAVRAAGLHAGQDELICALTTEPTMSTSQIADLLNIQSSTVSKTVDKLAKKGLVERVRVKSDHRKTALVLTAAGAETQALVREIWRGVEKSLFGDLSPSEVGEIRDGLDLLDNRLRERLVQFRRPLEQPITESDRQN